jgi:tetratricopeptide (TPR) repeat protein
MIAELFARLELEPGANRDEVRAAYFRLAKTLHPDRQAGDDPDATERFLQIQQAYEVLMDPSLRLEYERSMPKPDHTSSSPNRSVDSLSHRPVMGGRPASGPSDEELQDAERAYQRAVDLLDSGRSEPALRAMQAVVRVAPRFPRYRSLLGYCLALEGQNLHAARDHCRYAVEAEPFEADHQARLGFVYQQAGLQRTADKCFDEALRIEPRNAIAMSHYSAEEEGGGLFGAVKRIFSGG